MKRALVTGANRGIGLEVVRQLLMRGYEVVLGCRHREEGARAVKAWGENARHLSLLELDVSDEKQVLRSAKVFSQKFERLDVLINNAGVLLDRSESILSVSEADIVATMNINTLGPLRVTRAFLPFLKAGDDARVINVSSLAGQLKTMGAWAPAYSMSKVALNAVTRILAQELASENIKVNSVSPGWINTDMGGPEAPGTVEEGADTIVWSVDEASLNITGEFLRDRRSTDW